MKKYYIDGNQNSANKHEMHAIDCGHANRMKEKELLGDFGSAKEALKAAKERYKTKAAPCPWCCNECL